MQFRFAPGAWRYAVPVAALGVVLRKRFPRVWPLFVAVAGAILGFHRDPSRSVPEAGIVSPADGRVSVIRNEDGRIRVGIFMNVTDVHVNRSPVSGAIRSVTHSPGAHWPAFTKESDHNEKVVIDVDECEVTLIAGAFARRIHPYVEAGQNVQRGERIGHISFGSRVDVLLPDSVATGEIAVENGDQVVAGETVLVES